MLIFELFQIVVVCAFLYLAVNLVRYFFFRESRGGGIFGLSDKWIRDDELKERMKSGKKKDEREV